MLNRLVLRPKSWPGTVWLDDRRSPQELFAYIEDADLWRWRLPDSRCFHAAFGALGLEMDANANPAIFDQLLQLLPAELIARVKLAFARGRRCRHESSGSPDYVQEVSRTSVSC